MALHGNLLHQISPKSVTKYGKYEDKCIYTSKLSKTVIDLILTKPVLA